MPSVAPSDTIRILVATDNHVGYSERDAVRGDDSWRSFEEVISLASERDCDMVLLAGDLFHENKPSRKSLYHVMRILRSYCYGNRPCELEMISDPTEHFRTGFSHANYEDPDINVSIPVFSIHGNHDDPSGDGHYAALDLLEMSGLVNYYGRTPESDNIQVKPVLLQKGRTKLALYGMSNVRDERLFRTFRDGKVAFFQPTVSKGDWFNLLSVHQNHHAYTETGYLPEKLLPDFMDLVVWGHEHECLIDPRYNPENSFYVMQPGSSIATSLMPGEAVPKHVSIVEVTGKQFKCEPVRLKSVRPFVMKEIVLQEEKGMKALSKKDSNRTEITKHLMGIVEDLIEQANTEWVRIQDDPDSVTEADIPQPIIRLRVEYSAPEGGKFDCENPQRFSNRFVGKVANVNDVIQFHRKKSGSSKKSNPEAEMPEESVLRQITIDTVKVEKLVREFLMAQSLTILPQNSFGDAVSQFVDKDDKSAMQSFLEDSLTRQIKHLLSIDNADEDEIATAMEENRSKLEALFASGSLKRSTGIKLKPKPDNWDSDADGSWADQPIAIEISDRGSDDEENDDFEPVQTQRTVTSSRGRARTNGATRGAKAKTTRGAVASARSSKSGSNPGRAAKAKNTSVVSDFEDDDDDVAMLDDGQEEVPRATKSRTNTSSSTKPRATQAAKTSTGSKKAVTVAASSASSAPARQTRLNFSQPVPRPEQSNGSRKAIHEVSDDEISDDDDDDDDAFEPAPSARLRSRH